jgi:hypothetical protein
MQRYKPAEFGCNNGIWNTSSAPSKAALYTPCTQRQMQPVNARSAGIKTPGQHEWEGKRCCGDATAMTAAAVGQRQPLFPAEKNLHWTALLRAHTHGAAASNCVSAAAAGRVAAGHAPPAVNAASLSRTHSHGLSCRKMAGMLQVLLAVHAAVCERGR